MEFYRHFNDAQRLANSIDDWEVDSFSWEKGYVACAFAAIAYEELPQFELKKAKRAKVIPCDRYQAHVARWFTEQRRASVRQLDMNAIIEIIVRERMVVVISKLTRVIFVSLRGTTLSFADFKADLDVRRVRYSLGFGESVKLHRGFLDAVLECFDEVVEKIASINDKHVPVYITGHSLGGAMAAIFHARLSEREFHPFVHRRQSRIAPSVSCYTFGMPRYGDLAAKSVLPQPYHIFNEFDAIPTLPPTFIGFADSANEKCLNAIPEQTAILNKGNFALRSGKGIATVLGVSDHRMERYVERLDVMRNK
ncbi:lipase family protein [Nitrosospira multiformis]|jgi:predicted lipase|uniref:Lipase (Class 3) n=1 Tax=Nitrosospira multiformis TaxID=1231 RepID=A0A1I7I5I6_9PROT|nr:lipase family protein [Nitrosospira multiformis]SFU68036.1 Lipase (class 3) [Nitrosospira multiformis]